LVFLFWIATRGKNMKRILLTTTSLVLAAGVASAETTLTWSGTATAGLARDGKVNAVAATIGKNAKARRDAAATALGGAAADTENAVNDMLNAISAVADAVTNMPTTITTVANANSTAAQNAASAATARLQIATVRAAYAVGLASATVATDGTGTLTLVGGTLNGLTVIPGATTGTATVVMAGLTAYENALNSLFGTATAGTATGKMKQYSELNATVTGTVATDMGWTISAAMSVDAGEGYDFADDDTFDVRPAGTVALDSVSIDFGAGGKLTLDQDAVAHLVDADDDGAADLLYTNTFGVASFSVAADIDDGDSDHLVTAATEGTWAANVYTAGTAASAAADVQWSAKVSMPLAGTNVYFAGDEEGGDAYGVSGTYAGIGWSVDSKREAAEKDASKDRSNTIGVSYAAGALTLGATYNSIKDGDQWGVSAAYAAGALTMNLSTDEGSDWSASGAYALGSGASLVAGTNYTEDAYVGVSFAF
jgi:hypothetical protein